MIKSLAVYGAIVFASNLLPLISTNDCSVTSWIRTEARNELVGGLHESKHLTGQAMDIVCDTSAGKQNLTKQARALGYHVQWYRTHIHIEDFLDYEGSLPPQEP